MDNFTLEGLSLNGRICCLPFKVEDKVEGKVSSGFATHSTRAKLVSTQVVMFEVAAKNKHNNADAIVIGPGDTVYLKSDSLNHAWSKEIYEINGKSVIFLPREFIVFIVEG